MALDRKVDFLLDLKPDIAVICECAAPERLRARSKRDWIGTEPVWVGDNPNKGLGVFAFNGFAVTREEPHYPTLRHIAPVRVAGPVVFNLLAVWAQNASGGITRKHQSGPLRRSLKKYSALLADAPSIIAGDFNNNPIWDKPGWRINHMKMVELLGNLGLVSAYHSVSGEPPGEETTPTLYWRDRTADGPTYHIDYVFLPQIWVHRIEGLQVGNFEDWVGAGLSDHVPLIMDLDLSHDPPAARRAGRKAIQKVT